MSAQVQDIDTAKIDDGLNQSDAVCSLRDVQQVLDRLLQGQPRPRILEAGGGSTSYLSPTLLARSDITVVDIDPAQIARCTYATTKRVGDIQTLRFDRADFDLVVCFNVIEHLHNVAGALRGFAEGVRPGGLVFIGAPNPQSLPGVVTRLTPHKAHVFFYRHIVRYADAGKPGHPPFPVIFAPLVKPAVLREHMESLGFETISARFVESLWFHSIRKQRPALGWMLDRFSEGLNLALRGRTNVRLGDYHMVFIKGPRP